MKTKAELQQEVKALNTELVTLAMKKAELAALIEMQKWELEIAAERQNKTGYRLGQMTLLAMLLAVIPVIVSIFFPRVLP